MPRKLGNPLFSSSPELGNQCPQSAFLYSPPAERDKVGQRGTSLDRTDKI